MAEKIWGGHVTFIAAKTSILMNLLYFKISAGYKNMINCLKKLLFYFA